MRRLMLLRHAKSDWPGGVDDRQRPLAKRGREASLRMGEYMAEAELIPDLAVVSPARRAQETWELVSAAFRRDIARQDEPRIYEASASAILGVIGETAPEIRALLLVGHNPGFEALARSLIGTGREADLARLGRKYPTAGLAVIDFDIEHWSDVAPGLGVLERFETPESVGSRD
jgi:phosphohistidine phosphatase